MVLSEEQVEAFERLGGLLIPGLFSAEEAGVLRQAMAEMSDPAKDSVLLDAAGGLRMVYGLHRDHGAFDALSRHPRLAGPCLQLIGAPIYVYQSRLNIKPGLDRSAAPGYPWHQDFSTWHLRDGIPDPRVLVTFVFLDDVTACNAPLMYIPGSHHETALGLSRERPEDGAYYETPSDRVARAAGEGGVEAALGPAGSVFLMHCNLVHASGENISPLRRALCSMIFNAVDNQPTVVAEQPEVLVARDYTPIELLDDDCLLRFAA